MNKKAWMWKEANIGNTLDLTTKLRIVGMMQTLRKAASVGNIDL